jgi:hypothetical protein
LHGLSINKIIRIPTNNKKSGTPDPRDKFGGLKKNENIWMLDRVHEERRFEPLKTLGVTPLTRFLLFIFLGFSKVVLGF